MSPITCLRAIYEHDRRNRSRPMYVSSVESAERHQCYFGKLVSVDLYSWHGDGQGGGRWKRVGGRG